MDKTSTMATSAALLLGLALAPVPVWAQSASIAIKDRHVAASRVGATQAPRSEGDQTIVDGWPLYRTERGQEAFNAAMATLAATDAPAPSSTAFRGCAGLDCILSLPKVTESGWLPTGRLWVSPTEYVIFAASPRLRPGAAYRRRPLRSMRVFVFHEFHNSSRNTDLFDTVSSHKSSVFVPFYLSKGMTDAAGRRFVVVLQVAPYDVVSIHATNHGSAGPGIEVARNVNDAVDPLQNSAGLLVASVLKTAAPHLRIVNHRGSEGAPMLDAYARRLSSLRGRIGSPPVSLPFVSATDKKMASAAQQLGDLILRRGASPRIPVAARGIVFPKTAAATATAEPQAPALAAAASTAPLLVAPIRLATRSAHTPPAAATEPQLVEPARPAVRPMPARTP